MVWNAANRMNFFLKKDSHLHHIAKFSIYPPPPHYTRKGLNLHSYAAKALVIMNAFLGCKDRKYISKTRIVAPMLHQKEKRLPYLIDNQQSSCFLLVVDRGIEPLCQDWESCILTIRWIDQHFKERSRREIPSVRKEGDSNPRYGNPYGSLANCWFQPLTHPSKRRL